MSGPAGRTAAGLGLTDGGWAELANERGIVRCRAQLSADIRPDTVFLPFLFPADQRANLLTAAATDPISGMPEFKRTAVRVRAIDAPDLPATDHERLMADA